MKFQENYTTARIKDIISKDVNAKFDDVQAELKKIEVTEEAFLSAEMQTQLINKIEKLRITLCR
jgi:hypothetical protein